MIYLKKLSERDTRGDEQISFNRDAAQNFFTAPKDFIDKKSNFTIQICHSSKSSDVRDIELQCSTDYRFSTKFNSLIKEYESCICENDILYIDRVGHGYSFKIIKNGDASFDIYNKILDTTHKVICADKGGSFAEQKIYFGSPGSGKSHTIDEIYQKHESEGSCFRTIFHPDSDYSTFVGCYKPIMQKQEDGSEKITYKFAPQVFTNAYVKAWQDTSIPVYLIIEEINRGNCAQVFGDLFQLLDRTNGISDYPIDADHDLRTYLEEQLGVGHEGIKDGKLKLPPNLNIFATMNTSDQSLFPMDSAFKRRWEWEYVPIRYDEPKSSAFIITIGDKKYKWIKFLEKANDAIYKATHSEDKQMGNFFIKGDIDEKVFKDKVMFYMWNDVCKDLSGTKLDFFKTGSGTDSKSFTYSDLYKKDASKILNGFMIRLDVDEFIDDEDSDTDSSTTDTDA